MKIENLSNGAVIRTSEINTKGFQIMDVEFQFGFSTGVLIKCYDFWKNSYGLDFSTTVMIDVDIENSTAHNTFISICKALINFFEKLPIHESLKVKLGKYTYKEAKYRAAYFLAKLRELMGREYLPLTLSTYITLSKQL